MQDAHLFQGLRSDLFDVWEYFQRERETPGKERTRGSAQHYYIRVEGREKVANDHRVVYCGGGRSRWRRKACSSFCFNMHEARGWAQSHVRDPVIMIRLDICLLEKRLIFIVRSERSFRCGFSGRVQGEGAFCTGYIEKFKRPRLALHAYV